MRNESKIAIIAKPPWIVRHKVGIITVSVFNMKGVFCNKQLIGNDFREKGVSLPNWFTRVIIVQIR